MFIRAVRRSFAQSASCGVLDLGRFESHAGTQVVEVDKLPLPRVPQHPPQVFDQFLDSFAAGAFADRIRAPRAERIVGAIEVDLDDDEFGIIRIFGITDAYGLIPSIARIWLGLVVVGHTVGFSLLGGFTAKHLDCCH